MRSKLAAVAIGLGVFMIVAAVLVRAYAYPTLATVPADYKGTTYLEAKGAQVLDWESIQKPGPLVSNTHDLAIQAFTIADPGAKAPDGVVVWVSSTTVMQDDGTQFQRTQERAPFDGVSGAAVDCGPCDSWTSDTAVYDGQERVETPLERQGQVFKFPFGTEKKSYDVWDGTLGEATPATFEGTEKIDGLEVYKFVQKIEPTVVGTQELSGTKFGVADSANVKAELWYSMTRTFYVEPQTGSPVNRTEERMQELRYGGVAVPVFNGTVQYTAQQVKDLVNGTKDQTGAKDNAMLLGGLRLLFPLLLVLVGAALLVGGLYLGRKARSERDVKADEKPLVNA